VVPACVLIGDSGSPVPLVGIPYVLNGILFVLIDLIKYRIDYFGTILYQSSSNLIWGFSLVIYHRNQCTPLASLLKATIYLVICLYTLFLMLKLFPISPERLA
jgi:hypothetical protein